MLTTGKLADAVQNASELAPKLGERLDAHTAALEELGARADVARVTARGIADDLLLAAVILGGCIVVAAAIGSFR